MLVDLLRTIIPARWRPAGHIKELVSSRTGRRVLAGPFAGMHYVGASHCSVYTPKLLGIYERELAACVEAAIAHRPDTIIDAGAAEGYYAVGLALRAPAARVIAYEMDEQARRYLAEMAVLNGVEQRVEIRGRCDPADLAAALENTAQPLVVCDVEGHEAALLDPGAVGGLSKARILVELHEFVVRGIAETIARRFAPTHRITRIWEEERSASELPYSDWYTALLPKVIIERSVREWRPERMSWLWTEPTGD